MSNVKHVNFSDKLDPRVMLRQLAEADDLKGCITICLWDDGFTTCGWSNMEIKEVSLEIGEKNSTVVVKPFDKKDYTHIIMPLKI